MNRNINKQYKRNGLTPPKMKSMQIEKEAWVKLKNYANDNNKTIKTVLNEWVNANIS